MHQPSITFILYLTLKGVLCFHAPCFVLFCFVFVLCLVGLGLVCRYNNHRSENRLDIASTNKCTTDFEAGN